MYDTPLDDPLIGLASTRQLLTELIDRGTMESAYLKDGVFLAIAARKLLDALPTGMLDFRNVEKQGIPPIPDGVEGIPMGRHIRVLANAYDRDTP